MLTDGPDAKKVASEGVPGRGSSAAAAAAAQAAAVAARVAAAAAAGIQGLGVPGLALGPVNNEDVRVPDKMVGLSKFPIHHVLYYEPLFKSFILTFVWHILHIFHSFSQRVNAAVNKTLLN